jgi:hypothetical protein
MNKTIDYLLPGLEMNSECFTYENYESNWWSLFELDFPSSLETKNIKNIVDSYAIGYCDSSRVRVRPKIDTYAVMFEKDGLRFWFHLEKWYFEEG